MFNAIQTLILRFGDLWSVMLVFAGRYHFFQTDPIRVSFSVNKSFQAAGLSNDNRPEAECLYEK